MYLPILTLECNFVSTATPEDVIHANQMKENLSRVKQYCENNMICRRVQLLEYFGEVFDPINCRKNKITMCEVCRAQEKKV
jgi:superfamily II DNA helicase RecQ